MGQSASHPERRSEGSGPSRRPSILRRSAQHASGEAGQQDALLAGQPVGSPRIPRARPRPRSIYRLSQLLHPNSGPEDINEQEQDRREQSQECTEGSRTSQMLQRTRSTFRDMLGRSGSVRGPRPSRTGPTLRARGNGTFLHRQASYQDAMENLIAPQGLIGPQHLHSHFDDVFEDDSLAVAAPDSQSGSSAANHRPNLRLSSLRPERSGISRRLASFRRRRPAQPEIRRVDGGEDQAAMLSRLLSVAAAATAATLMGDDHNALSEARSLTSESRIGEIGGGGEDGSFDGFLRSLQNGRIASALRAGTDPEGSPSESGGPPAPLNFFRMFRFGTGNASSAAANPPAPGSESNNNDADSRMVPIIIVGIRSISPNPGAATDGSEAELPPFIDALGNFPSPLPTHAFGAHGHDSIDSILRPPQNGTSFRHRRRASMGAFGMSRNRLSDRMDDQRDHRSPERRRERPWSMASSSSAFEPRPPPATPASPSPELSRISSRQTTPNTSRRASFIANSMRELTEDSRRSSILRRSSGPSPLSSHTEETSSLHSTHSGTNLLTSPDAEHFSLHPHRRSETNPNIHYPRFASGHPRRNGVVEPDHLPHLSRTGSTSNATDDVSGGGADRRNSTTNDSRSWIIYVLGGSYPEDHPILTTPSLFTENPTYEDMMLLSALLGPAKAPVASEEDVQSAGGLYSTQLVGENDDDDAAKTAQLVAVATDGEAAERVYLEVGQRCLVCLCEFEAAETARKLVKCNHLFHQECIDQWLTQGRNSCPLCRGQGVNETEKPASAPAVATANGEATGNLEPRESVRNSGISSDYDDWPSLHS